MFSVFLCAADTGFYESFLMGLLDLLVLAVQDAGNRSAVTWKQKAKYSTAHSFHLCLI